MKTFAACVLATVAASATTFDTVSLLETDMDLAMRSLDTFSLRSRNDKKIIKLWENMLKKYDRNGNKELTCDDTRSCHNTKFEERLGKYDVDQNGTITELDFLTYSYGRTGLYFKVNTSAIGMALF